MGRPRAGGWRATDPKALVHAQPLLPQPEPLGTCAHLGHSRQKATSAEDLAGPPRGWGCPWELQGMTALSCPPRGSSAGGWEGGGAW